jgi:hypothetical protein
MTISIAPNGRHTSQVDAEDIGRARDAAEAVLAQRGVTAEAAYAAYQAQWLEFDDEDPMTGDALAWIAAGKAADIAITAGWANENAEIFCDMSA